MEKIDHFVVCMFENRSFDNLLGYLYDPNHLPNENIPPNNPPTFDGLAFAPYENSDPQVNGGNPVPAQNGTSSWGGHSPNVVPNPDPGEAYAEVDEQMATIANPTMSGFLSNYVKKVSVPDDARQIMQSFSPNQVPVLSALARAFAVSDAWFSSVPTQTWPNRGFTHCGSSAGYIDNDHIVPYSIATIFDVLSKKKISWNVFANTLYTPSLTHLQFVDLYTQFGGHFASFNDFERRCAQPANATPSKKLPSYSFIEPRFLAERDLPHLNVLHSESYHPPRNVGPCEQFLARLYKAVRTCAYRDRILLLILFDEHGGCYDHAIPPAGAQPPKPNPTAGGFKFDRFGPRVPAIAISSYVRPGTVFRSTTTNVPYDHTSILSTLRDWKQIKTGFLPSPRIAAAPTLDAALVEQNPTNPWPDIATPHAMFEAAMMPAPEEALDADANDLEQAIAIATHRMLRYHELAQRGLKTQAAKALTDKKVADTLRAQLRTRRDAVEFVRMRTVAANADTKVP